MACQTTANTLTGIEHSERISSLRMSEYGSTAQRAGKDFMEHTDCRNNNAVFVLGPDMEPENPRLIESRGLEALSRQ